MLNEVFGPQCRARTLSEVSRRLEPLAVGAPEGPGSALLGVPVAVVAPGGALGQPLELFLLP